VELFVFFYEFFIIRARVAQLLLAGVENNDLL